MYLLLFFIFEFNKQTNTYFIKSNKKASQITDEQKNPNIGILKIETDKKDGKMKIFNQLKDVKKVSFDKKIQITDQPLALKIWNLYDEVKAIIGHGSKEIIHSLVQKINERAEIFAFSSDYISKRVTKITEKHKQEFFLSIKSILYEIKEGREKIFEKLWSMVESKAGEINQELDDFNIFPIVAHVLSL